MPRGIERPQPPTTAGYERLSRLADERRPGSASARARRPRAAVEVNTHGPSARFLLAAVGGGLFLLLMLGWFRLG